MAKKTAPKIVEAADLDPQAWRPLRNPKIEDLAIVPGAVGVDLQRRRSHDGYSGLLARSARGLEFIAKNVLPLPEIHLSNYTVWFKAAGNEQVRHAFHASGLTMAAGDHPNPVFDVPDDWR